MKINIGAGDQKIEGFISVDYDPNCNPDYLVNIEKEPLPFPDNSVEKVIIHHVLEHMGEGYFHFLQELYRVCKHGAMIDILVPHPRHDYYLNDPTHRRPITVEGMWLFSKKYNEVCRKQGARASRLADYFGVDFEVIDSSDIPDPRFAAMFEGQPVEAVKNYLPQHNNIIMEVRILLVAIKQYD